MTKMLIIPKTLKLVGKKLYLRLLGQQDISQRYVDWLNDPLVVKYMRHRERVHSLDTIRDFINSRQWPNDLTLAIVDKATDLHVGNIGLTAIDWSNQKAELGMLLGDRNFWQKGYMSEAFDLISQYAFHTLKLNRLYAGCEFDNKGAIRLFKAKGWQREGRLKQEIWREGKPIDVIRFGLLKEYLVLRRGR